MSDESWWRAHLRDSVLSFETPCAKCGRALGTVDDMRRLLSECGEDPRELDEHMPGWAIDLCWRRPDVACTRRTKWASDAKITLARIVFSFYVSIVELGQDSNVGDE